MIAQVSLDFSAKKQCTKCKLVKNAIEYLDSSAPKVASA